MEEDLSGIEPCLLWRHFDELRKIPRCSKREERAAEYVLAVGRRMGLDCGMDGAGNVLLRKGATAGREGSRAVLLQAHLDMVCEKDRGSDHDFSRDPILVRVDDGFVSAVGTTLGADNGIGVAAALAVLADPGAVHGPLELLFTVDEEEGMSGARAVQGGQIAARMMINLDTDDPHAVYVGCAGGETSNLRIPMRWDRPDPAGASAFEVVVGGLSGGHSGVDIHLQRGNAIKLLGLLLWAAGERVFPGLSSLRGGEKHNAIPREAEAVVVVPREEAEAFSSLVEAEARALREEYRAVDPGLWVEVSAVEMPARVASLEAGDRPRRPPPERGPPVEPRDPRPRGDLDEPLRRLHRGGGPLPPNGLPIVVEGRPRGDDRHHPGGGGPGRRPGREGGPLSRAAPRPRL